jgi:hypothetical protein
MSLEGKYFGLDIDRAKRGEGAWDRISAIRSGVRVLQASVDSEVSIDFDNGVRRRRLRRAGSKVAQEGIWEGILGGTGDVHHLPQDEIQASRNEPLLVVETSVIGNHGSNYDDTPRPLFEGLTFCISCFTEKKVSLA